MICWKRLSIFKMAISSSFPMKKHWHIKSPILKRGKYMLQLVHKTKNMIVETRKKSEVRELSSFLYRISTLLDEGYTFSDSIMMLLPYHVKNMDDWKYQLYQ